MVKKYIMGTYARISIAIVCVASSSSVYAMNKFFDITLKGGITKKWRQPNGQQARTDRSQQDWQALAALQTARSKNMPVCIPPAISSDIALWLQAYNMTFN